MDETVDWRTGGLTSGLDFEIEFKPRIVHQCTVGRMKKKKRRNINYDNLNTSDNTSRLDIWKQMFQYKDSRIAKGFIVEVSSQSLKRREAEKMEITINLCASHICWPVSYHFFIAAVRSIET